MTAVSPRVWKPQGAAIFNRRLLKVGDFKSPFLGLRHPAPKITPAFSKSSG
jgi:hypothetical protein